MPKKLWGISSIIHKSWTFGGLWVKRRGGGRLFCIIILPFSVNKEKWIENNESYRNALYGNNTINYSLFTIRWALRQQGVSGPPEVRSIVSCVPSRLLRRVWFPIGSSARRAKNVPPARFLNARSNPFGYYANQNKRHPKRVPFVLVRPKSVPSFHAFHLVCCGVFGFL